jgi:glycosyltransferase involved in cell wall biosynthesis
MILPVILFHLPAPGVYALGTGFNIAVINTFSFDEPVAEILEAARQLPEVNFYITGNPCYADQRLIAQKPDNVIFTGFLETSAYVALLKNAHAVMCLTTEPDSIQNGASEALALGTPIITSDSGLMRDVFPQGTVLVQNQPQSIIDGINQMRSEYMRYKQEVPALQESWITRWKVLEQKLLEVLNG